MTMVPERTWVAAAAEQRTIDEPRKDLKRMRPRDERADCAGHRQVPDEREAVTGLQRSTSRRRRRALRRRRRRHAPRLERWPLRARKRQRGRTYGAEVEQVVLKVLKVLKVWAGRDVLCAERLTPPRLAPARHDTARHGWRCRSPIASGCARPMG